MTVQTDPKLSGMRPEGPTMSMQSAMLGVPSIQLELPPLLRDCLVKDVGLCELLASGIAKVFRETVTPWWHARYSKDGVPTELTEASRIQEDADGSNPVGACELEDPFAMLGGMAASTRDANSENSKAEVVEVSMSSIRKPSEEWAASIRESGPADASYFDIWSTLLLTCFLQWEESYGNYAPQI